MACPPPRDQESRITGRSDHRTSAEFATEIKAALEELAALGDEQLLPAPGVSSSFVSEGDAKETAAREAIEHDVVSAQDAYGEAQRTPSP